MDSNEYYPFNSKFFYFDKIWVFYFNKISWVIFNSTILVKGFLDQVLFIVENVECSLFKI